MSSGIFTVPAPHNEPVRDYAPGSPERESLKRRLAEMDGAEIEIPMIIGGEEVRTGTTGKAVKPHDHEHVLATYHQGGAAEVQRAIDAARQARDGVGAHALVRSAPPSSCAPPSCWPARGAHAERRHHARPVEDRLPGRDRRGLRAGRLLALQRRTTCERILREQPVSSPGMWNRSSTAPLEGFVFAVTPFNFTAIGGNLPTAPALMGNTVVLEAGRHRDALGLLHHASCCEEAGLPPGVINLVLGIGARDRRGARWRTADLAGVHFTGSTAVFQRDVADGRREHRPLPQLSAPGRRDRRQGLHLRPPLRRCRGAGRRRSCAARFEYQGQKCSAASPRLHPASPVAEVRERARRR